MNAGPGATAGGAPVGGRRDEMLAHQGRLLLPAAAVWLVAWWGTAATPQALLLIGLTFSLVGVVAWVLVLTAAQRAATGLIGSALVLALFAAAATALGLGPRVAELRSGPIADLAAQRAGARLVVTVTGDPRRTANDESFVVPVRVDEAHRLGGESAVRAPALLVGGRELESLQWDGRYEIRGVLRPPDDPADRLTAVVLTRGSVRQTDPPDVLWRVAGRIREGLAATARGAPGPGSVLVPALVLGDTRGVPDELTTDMQTVGLAHLSAVSGMNVTIVCGGVLALLAWARAGPRTQAACGAAALAALVVTARPEPSVLRAAAMGAVGLLGLVAGRPGRGPAALAAAVLVLLAVDPWLSRSYGFALSVLATTGIVAWARPLALRLSRLVPRPLADVVAVTVSAQAAVTPLLVHIDPAVSPYAIVTNVLVAPVVPVVTLAGTLAAGLSALLPDLALVFAVPAAAGATWITWVASVSADLPVARVPWPSGAPGVVLACLLPSALFVTVRPGRLRMPAVRRWDAVPSGVRRAVAALLPATVLLVAVSPLAPRSSWIPSAWTVVVCDVGQGEAVLIRSGPDEAIAVDTGPDPAAFSACLDAAGVRAVPLLVLTHFHADHVSGLPGLLGRAAVSEAWHSPTIAPQPAAGEALGLLRRAGVPAYAASTGRVAQVGSVRLTVLWPDAGLAAPVAAEAVGTMINDAGVVVRVDLPDLTFLALGDVEIAAQQRLVRRDPVILDADVTTIAHHGSRSQLPGLYTRVSPVLAVASAGEDNDYGHPDPLTLDTVASIGAAVLVTDESGGVAVAADHDGLRVTTQRRPRQRRPGQRRRGTGASPPPAARSTQPPTATAARAAATGRRRSRSSCSTSRDPTSIPSDAS
jgi:competence protein ComEC